MKRAILFSCQPLLVVPCLSGEQLRHHRIQRAQRSTGNLDSTIEQHLGASGSAEGWDMGPCSA
ncbi:hypothetical protein KSP39_PZI013864 [Platanthera zijinensis]|uniref:Uncharacterized protein n=1 Tax=Platanthera zijinensis TaxID=2320716 RepID=A0AAP0BBJ7_9ASPA